MADAWTQEGFIFGLAHVGDDALALVGDAERGWETVGVGDGDPEDHVASFGVLRSDEAFEVGPFLLIDVEAAVALLPFVVDHDGADGEAALVECGEPLFIIRLRGELVGRAAMRDGFDGLLGPSAEDGQVMPVDVFCNWIGCKSVYSEPGGVVAEGVERAVGHVDGENGRGEVAVDGAVAHVVDVEGRSGIARAGVFERGELIVAGFGADADAGPRAVEVEGEEERWRREGSGHALGAEVLLGAFFAADAEAENLRHGDVEFELVGEVGVGCEVAVGVDGRVPCVAGGGAVVPAVGDSVGEEVAAAESAGSGGELLELDVVGEESPLEAAACPEIAFCCSG